MNDGAVALAVVVCLGSARAVWSTLRCSLQSALLLVRTLRQKYQQAHGIEAAPIAVYSRFKAALERFVLNLLDPPNTAQMCTRVWGESPENGSGRPTYCRQFDWDEYTITFSSSAAETSRDSSCSRILLAGRATDDHRVGLKNGVKIRVRKLASAYAAERTKAFNALKAIGERRCGVRSPCTGLREVPSRFCAPFFLAVKKRRSSFPLFTISGAA